MSNFNASPTGISGITEGIGNYFYSMSQLSLPAMIWQFFLDFGWIILLYMFILAARQMYKNIINGRFLAKQHYVLLAIDIPRDTKQSVKAVENLITGLSGGHWAKCWREEWLQGIVQLSFSLEIVSIEGHIQFLIHTPVQYRALIEASVHTQYPDAEITEVEDYTNDFPSKFPDEKYNWKGGEFGPVKSDGIPIRTYPEFEDPLDGEFKDPLAFLMENMSKLEKGEQAWYQLIVQPTGFDWVKKCDAAADKILGVAPKAGKDIFAAKILLAPFRLIEALVSEAFGYSSVEVKKKEPRKVMDLTPGEKEALEKIQAKKHKMGFICKLRIMYLAERQVFKGWRLGGLVASVKQFNSNTINSMRPYWDKYGTGSNYFFEWRRKRKIAWKQNYIMGLYKKRDGYYGYPPYVMNSEEIASLWHFPSIINVKSALLKRTESKKSEAPVNLPIAPEGEVLTDDKASAEVIEDWEDVKEFTFDIENDYFEERFAKDKGAFKKRQEERKVEKEKAEMVAARTAEIKTAKEEKVIADLTKDLESTDDVLADNFFADKLQVDETDGEILKQVQDDSTNGEPPSNLPI